MAGCAFEKGWAGEVAGVEGGFGGEFGGGWHCGVEEVEEEGGDADGEDGGDFEDCGGGDSFMGRVVWGWGGWECVWTLCCSI